MGSGQAPLLTRITPPNRTSLLFFFLKKGAQWRSLYTHHLFLALQGVSRLAIPRGLSPPQFQLRINPVAAALAVNTQDSLHPLLVLIAHNYLTH